MRDTFPGSLRTSETRAHRCVFRYGQWHADVANLTIWDEDEDDAARANQRKSILIPRAQQGREHLLGTRTVFVQHS